MLTIVHRAIFSAIILLLIPAGCKREESPSSLKQQSVKICMGGILAPLPFVALEKELFQAEGISAEISQLGDGKAAMSAFLEGACDAVVSGEFPVVRQSFERNDLAVIATISSSDNAVKILARKDRGIITTKDLAGKKLGVSKGTISGFFLDQFLKKNGIPVNSLTIAEISHRELANALHKGEIDAFPGSDVSYLKAKKLVGAQGITFTERGLTNHAACFTVKKKWLSEKPEVARKLLKALVKAENELFLHPDELASRLSARLSIATEDLKKIMDEQSNRVRIDHVILLAMEDEARWMMENGMVKEAQLPNFLHLLAPAVLKSVQPAAVTIR